MPQFKQRSYQKELLDNCDIPFEDIRINMTELDRINHYLGGHVITIKGVSEFGDINGLHIVEIGCGGGDNLRAIKNWALKNNKQVRLTGVDINVECIEYARSKKENSMIEFIRSDYKAAKFEQRPDIIFSSLFCHHFTDDELVFMLGWMRENSNKGFFINDLHRHKAAYYSIRMLTGLFSKSYLVKNDAPLSVQRGFIKREWEDLFKKAGISNFKCQWKWAFRWLLTFKHAPTNPI
jgi:2-polyprenyl-3-methyl-5-hydroxy-6-metoxy-1,4-benzoquinol methylase